MIIEVIGKAHIEGIGKKSGKPFNSNVLHYNTPARNVTGLAAETVMVDAVLYPFDTIVVGGRYDIQFDRYGYVVGCERVD